MAAIPTDEVNKQTNKSATSQMRVRMPNPIRLCHAAFAPRSQSALARPNVRLTTEPPQFPDMARVHCSAVLRASLPLRHLSSCAYLLLARLHRRIQSILDAIGSSSFIVYNSVPHRRAGLASFCNSLALLSGSPARRQDLPNHLLASNWPTTALYQAFSLGLARLTACCLRQRYSSLLRFLMLHTTCFVPPQLWWRFFACSTAWNRQIASFRRICCVSA